MIYVDSCIPMYLVGTSHPNKERVISLLTKLAHSREVVVTSAEAYQELIHRFKAIQQSKSLQICYEALEHLTSRCYSVEKEDVDVARGLAGQFPNLSSRDCLHSAIMKRIQCSQIWTFDRGFEVIPSLIVLH